MPRAFILIIKQSHFFAQLTFINHLKFDKIKTKAFLVCYKKRNLHAKLQHLNYTKSEWFSVQQLLHVIHL